MPAIEHAAGAVRFVSGPLDGEVRCLPDRRRWYVAYRGPLAERPLRPTGLVRAVPHIYERFVREDGAVLYLYRGEGATCRPAP